MYGNTYAYQLHSGSHHDSTETAKDFTYFLTAEQWKWKFTRGLEVYSYMYYTAAIITRRRVNHQSVESALDIA